MNKKQLVVKLSGALNLSKADAERTFDTITNTILDAGESTLKKFAERGGIVTELSGAEKSKFDAMMTDKVMPAMADMFDKEVLLAAEAFAK